MVTIYCVSYNEKVISIKTIKQKSVSLMRRKTLEKKNRSKDNKQHRLKFKNLTRRMSSKERRAKEPVLKINRKSNWKFSKASK